LLSFTGLLNGILPTAGQMSRQGMDVIANLVPDPTIRSQFLFCGVGCLRQLWRVVEGLVHHFRISRKGWAVCGSMVAYRNHVIEIDIS
jgi:hypothetical protein